ncbi:MAG: acetolactate decarboxylase [Bernardetiaceae bacterium]|nr:acetolactate decarboxylase [Bernardetiaceae bacterium]
MHKIRFRFVQKGEAETLFLFQKNLSIKDFIPMKSIKIIILCVVALLTSLPLLSQMPKVYTAGEAKKVMKGIDLSMHLDWDSLPKNNLYGLAPKGRLEGELLFINGTTYHSFIDSKGNLKLDTSSNQSLQSPFAVYTYVESWEPFFLTEDINNEHDLQQVILHTLKVAGYDLALPIPFRIECELDYVKYHVINKPKSEKIHNHELHKKAKTMFEEENQKGQILGFFSMHHEGVFTHKGHYMHMHYLSGDKMGHLDELKIKKGEAILWLPKLPKDEIFSLQKQVRTIDTDFSKGRLSFEQDIAFSDLIKFHGHFCDGLLVGYQGLAEALAMLYPDGTIDRTNTRIVSRSSPCLTDVAVYLTGARYQFNTFYVSDDIDYMYIVQRIDNGKAVGVNLKKGVKPEAIDRLGAQAVAGELSPCALDSLRKLEDDFALYLKETPIATNYSFQNIEGFEWSPILKNDFIKTDILNKDQPACR